MKSLDRYLGRRYIKREAVSKQEIADILSLVERDLQECRKEGISRDWRFNIAYNAGLQLCKAVLRASGYRTTYRSPSHQVTIECLTFIMGPGQKKNSDYLDNCRGLRNKVEYDVAGAVGETDLLELIDLVVELRLDVLSWLRNNHPDLLQ